MSKDKQDEVSPLELVQRLQKKSGKSSVAKPSTPAVNRPKKQGPKATQIDLWGHSIHADPGNVDRQRGYTSEEIKSSALGIFNQMANDDNLHLTEVPEDEVDKHPTRYCRSGIFAASPASQLKKHLDESNHRHIESQWGKYIINGLLTTDHEDTIMAIRHIAESKVRVTFDRKMHRLPNSWPLEIIRNEQDIPLDEEVVFFTAHELLTEMGKDTNGYYYKWISRYLRELDMATITEISKLDGPDGKPAFDVDRGSEKIVSIKRVEWEGQGLYMATFHPGFLQEIKTKGTYSSWNTRKKLKKPISKNIHGFMESQDTSSFWIMQLDKWDGVVGYYGRRADRLKEYRVAAEELVENEVIQVAVFLNSRSRIKKKPPSLDLFKSKEEWEAVKSKDKRYTESKYFVIEKTLK